MNLLQKDFNCIECNSKHLIKDNIRNEIYCSKCGLILRDDTIATLTQLNDMCLLHQEYKAMEIATLKELKIAIHNAPIVKRNTDY